MNSSHAQSAASGLSAGPSLSAILVTPDDLSAIAATIRHLRAQTIAEQIELIIVAPLADRIQLTPDDRAPFHSIRVVEIVELRSLSVARAAGVAAATAPVVAFNEDHSFPEPGWAAALLDGHSRGYTGVAPQMKNANPTSALSWAAMFLHFGGAVEPEGGFETAHPAASHNMSYTRNSLLEMGDRLAEVMLAELFLHNELSMRGHKFWVQPSAVTHHVNISRVLPSLVHAWVGGRLYGGLRHAFGSWPITRRIVYAGGSALVPALRLSRVIPLMRRTRAGRGALPRALPAMTLILAVHAMGEAFGYLFGTGKTALWYSEFETRRDRHVRVEERALWA